MKGWFDIHHRSRASPLDTAEHDTKSPFVMGTYSLATQI